MLKSMGVTRIVLAVALVSVMVAGVSGIAYAATCATAAGSEVDLTSGGTDVSLGNGALVSTTDSQATGTGVIQSFVRIYTNEDCEEGYNTSGRPLEYDENSSPTFTRDLPLAAVPIVEISGTDYREFLLDINQTSANSELSLEEIEIWQAADAGLLGFTPGSGFGGADTLRYNLDSGGDQYIRLDYLLNKGSGSGDMFLYVPNSFFSGDAYVYLWSRFGDHQFNNDGFEEWAVRTTTTLPTPEPSSSLLLSLALIGTALLVRKFAQSRG